MSDLPRHLAGLMHPSAYPHEVRDVQLIETHVSWVFLTGDYAYKIKRPVMYPFIDLRSAERRAFYCAEEVRLNRRFAPDLYLETCDIHERNGAAHVGGDGRVIECCVRMRQFARAEELDRLLDSARLEPAVLEEFGRAMADIHATLPAVAAGDPWGSAEQVRYGIRRNVEEYEHAASQAGFPVEPGVSASIDARLEALAATIETRRALGRVRECHGDLHARNIVRRGNRLVAFDCMEFEPAFRWIDVAEEIALLVADLEARDCAGHAHAFLNSYLLQSGDYGLCRVLDLYKAHRALTRAKVAVLESSRGHHDAQIRVARRALSPRSAHLILMKGLSGSGKTWLARQLAPDLGAIHLRSDVERKRLAGMGELGESHSAPGGGLYSADNTLAAYSHLLACTESVLMGGYSVIVDATFLLRSQRTLFSSLARRLGVPLQVVCCESPAPVLRNRIEARHVAALDASEADLAVLEWQLSHAEPILSDESLRVVTVSTGQQDPVSSALQELR